MFLHTRNHILLRPLANGVRLNERGERSKNRWQELIIILSMTLPRRPPSYNHFHHNLLLRIAIYHPHLTVRLLTNLKSASGELIFPQGELRIYCGRLLTRLKSKRRGDLLAELDKTYDPFCDIQPHPLLPSTSSSTTNKPKLSHSPPRPPQHLSTSTPSPKMTKTKKSPKKSTPKRVSRSVDRDRSFSPPPPAGLHHHPSSEFPEPPEGGTKKYHSWGYDREGLDPETKFCVVTAPVNDSEKDPTFSVTAARVVIPVKNETLLTEESQMHISTGLCADKKGRPSVFVKQPCNNNTELDNKMEDLKLLGMLANVQFGGDNRAMNEEMNKAYIEAVGMNDHHTDVVTLPNLSQYLPEDDGDGEDDEEGLSYSNGMFSMKPDRANKLTIGPGEYELSPIVYYPKDGKKVTNLSTKMSVQNGYIMVQVLIHGSRRELSLPEAKKPEDSDRKAYFSNLAAATEQFKATNLSG